MKNKLLKIFLLLTGFVYLTSVLELDSNECKQNFQNEQHFCIATAKTSDNFSFHSDKTFALPFTFTDINLRCNFKTAPVLLFHFAEYSPPDKIYLRQHSLLI